MSLVTFSIQHGPKFAESVKLTSLAQIPFFTPKKTGNSRWRILNEVTGEVIDSYTPPAPPKRDKPITGWKGSWAASLTTTPKGDGIQDPKALPAIFQNEQRLLNQIRRSHGECSYSPEAAAYALAQELTTFPQ